MILELNLSLRICVHMKQAREQLKKSMEKPLRSNDHPMKPLLFFGWQFFYTTLLGQAPYNMAGTLNLLFLIDSIFPDFLKQSSLIPS